MEDGAERRGRLTERERQTLTSLADEVVEGSTIVGICAYGSRVAGYASEESDYDLLIALRDFRPRVKYRYVKGEVDASALIVDGDALTEDAEKASLGEFVAGRLLNIYEPLAGGEVLRDVELKLKRRVMVETIQEVASLMGEFTQELLIPIEYFLFEKLKRRAAIYPPALYSYSKTYGGPMGRENTEASCTGFLEVARELEAEGVIELHGRDVRIRSSDLGRLGVRFSSLARYAQRGLTQYAVHGYAGRVSLNIVSKEVTSKISRTRRGFEVPDVLRQPKSLWRIDEGLLITEGDDWLGLVLKQLGLRRSVDIVEDHMGEVYSASKVCTVREEGGEVKFAVKKFADVKAVKWAFLNLWAIASKRFDMSPLSRLYREYSSLGDLRGLGLDTPKVIAVALDQRILVTEYIYGANVGQAVSQVYSGDDEGLKIVSLYGEAVARAHRAGYTLGDTKPSNAVYSNGRVYLVDLEQAAPGGDKAWDLAEFIYYSSKLTVDSKSAEKIVKEFLDGYLKYGDTEALKDSLKIKYLAPFQPILAPNVLRVVRREVRRMVKGGA